MPKGTPAATKPANLNLSDLQLYESDPIEREIGPGRAMSEETLTAISWLQASHEGGDGTHGKTLAITVPAGASDYTLNVLTRAGQYVETEQFGVGIGVDKQPVNIKGGKVEIRFATRPKRARKPKNNGTVPDEE